MFNYAFNFKLLERKQHIDWNPEKRSSSLKYTIWGFAKINKKCVSCNKLMRDDMFDNGLELFCEACFFH